LAGAVVWGWASYFMLTWDDRMRPHNIETVAHINPDFLLEDGTVFSSLSLEEQIEFVRVPRSQRLMAWYMASFAATLAAIALTLLAWLKNNAKMTLIAAILYLVSLNIPAKENEQ